MCVDPVTATVIGATVFSAVGGAMSTEGAVNADRQNARNAMAVGYEKESMSRSDARREMATQVATLSMRGAALDSGSPLALQQESARNSELNALTIRSNAQNDAASYDYKASAAQQAMPFSVAGQLLGGASKLAALGKI